MLFRSGANASGKTTMLKALDFITAFPRQNPRLGTGILFNFESFNHSESTDAPIKLAIEFGGMMNLNSSEESVLIDREYGVFRYEAEFSRSESGGHSVSRELLVQKPESSSKWRRIIDRNGPNIKGPTKDVRFFPLTGYSKILDKLPLNTSIFATLAEFQHAPSIALVEASRSIYTNVRMSLGADQDVFLANFLNKAPEVVARLNDDLRRVDLGLNRMRVEETPTGISVLFKHDGLEDELPWPAESQGTRALDRKSVVWERVYSSV